VSGVPSVPASGATAPGWDGATLAAVEALLRDALGPMARLVVRDAARRCTDLGTLVTHLATTVLDSEDARELRARAEDAWPGLRAAAPASATALPVLGTTPMRPDLVQKAERVLADHIGPIAGLLARRAAAGTRTREAFYTALADAAGDEVDRRGLLAQLWEIA
jgi:eukaryotic-like serine/threonine-protein kinase